MWQIRVVRSGESYDSVARDKEPEGAAGEGQGGAKQLGQGRCGVGQGVVMQKGVSCTPKVRPK